MNAPYRIPRQLLGQTFDCFRKCGNGRRECQVLWVSPWAAPQAITEVVHPVHDTHLGGFVLDDGWISAFWLRLAQENLGVRVQVHTHPGPAFHSQIDDEFPVIHKPGFLSLVIPNYAFGPVGFTGAYLAEIQEGGSWAEVPTHERISVE